MEQIKLGIVGACGRGKSFKLACDAQPFISIHAVCDVYEAGLDEAKDTLGAAMSFTDYEVMLEQADVDAVILGTPYYAEGEYLHELKALNEETVWRRKWQTGYNGITYGTHSLGPILQWMPGDRVVEVSCRGSGHHYSDLRGDQYENEDTCVMLCKMASGGLVKIRVDMLSDRPHAMTNYQLQGTDGVYESARAHGEVNRIWLRTRNDDANTWIDLEHLRDEFLPESWKAGLERAKETGHGGGDYFVIMDFADTVSGRKENPIGIHEAMDMSLPGLVSQQSIEQDGAWIEVPDSRKW